MATSYQNQNPSGNPSGYNSTYRDQASIYIGDAERTLFSTKQIRSAFVSKVYTILLLQLLVASTLIAWFTLHEPTKKYFNSSGATWLYLSLGVGFFSVLILTCIESARRRFPLNFIFLSLITISYGIIAAVFSARYNTITVLSAFAATAFATLVILLLAKYSSFDITTCGCGLCILSLVHLFVGILLILILVPLGYAKIVSVVIATSGAFLVSLYMLYDMQLIMGGRTLELSPEEYIMGAVMLYIDILQLFQYMLIMFARD